MAEIITGTPVEALLKYCRSGVLFALLSICVSYPSRGSDVNESRTRANMRSSDPQQA